MESYRIIASHADLDGVPVDFSYADVFVVLRDGASDPAPTDWEAQIHTDRGVPVAQARHELAFEIADGTCLRGPAILRFSDGHRHLFRGDGELDGFVAVSPEDRR
ncbi:hypothetical protein [Actinospongicola halichondriae]|uniref:hypothetical protein n=1 Tax=Actinospongicola halichondriae TaxID=3236844 RepID=UPI003D543215